MQRAGRRLRGALATRPAQRCAPLAPAGTEKPLNPREIAARELSERIYQQGQVVQKLRAADPTPESKKALFEAIQVLKELKATEH